MSAQSSFWSRTYNVLNGRVTLRLYFGELKVSELPQLLAEAVTQFQQLGVPYDSMILATNRAGLHFSNFLRMDRARAEALGQQLESQQWKQASD